MATECLYAFFAVVFVVFESQMQPNAKSAPHIGRIFNFFFSAYLLVAVECLCVVLVVFTMCLKRKCSGMQNPPLISRGFLNFVSRLWFDVFFLVPGRLESCRRFRDLQKSIVILSSGAVWTRSVKLLMKTLPPPKDVSLTLDFLALRRSGMYGRFRNFQKSIVILSSGAV